MREYQCNKQGWKYTIVSCNQAFTEINISGDHLYGNRQNKADKSGIAVPNLNAISEKA